MDEQKLEFVIDNFCMQMRLMKIIFSIAFTFFLFSALSLTGFEQGTSEYAITVMNLITLGTLSLAIGTASWLCMRRQKSATNG